MNSNDSLLLKEIEPAYSALSWECEGIARSIFFEQIFSGVPWMMLADELTELGDRRAWWVLFWIELQTAIDAHAINGERIGVRDFQMLLGQRTELRNLIEIAVALKFKPKRNNYAKPMIMLFLLKQLELVKLNESKPEVVGFGNRYFHAESSCLPDTKVEKGFRTRVENWAANRLKSMVERDLDQGGTCEGTPLAAAAMTLLRERKKKAAQTSGFEAFHPYGPFGVVGNGVK